MDKEWKEIGVFGVDSGQVLITDPSYLEYFGSGEFNEDKIKEMKESKRFEYSYSGACARTLSKKQGGEIGDKCEGVVSCTGYGDGLYSVFAKYEDKRVKELLIKFF